MKKKVKNGELLLESVDQELFIDDEQLNEELLEQPLLFRKYTKIKAQLVSKVSWTKQKLKETEAIAYLKYSQDGGKVKEVEAAVDIDADVKKLRGELIEAEEMLEEFEGVVSAFRQRHEVLKELNANKRHELV